MLLEGYSVEYIFPDNGKEIFWFDKMQLKVQYARCMHV